VKWFRALRHRFANWVFANLGIYNDDDHEEQPVRAGDEEVLYPPRGYCIGVMGHGQGDGLIGPFATEAIARAALDTAQIFIIGANAKPDWDMTPAERVVQQ
jgi:hypothetical protein